MIERKTEYLRGGINAQAISDNMSLTPEGFLACFGATITIAGHTTFSASELPTVCGASGSESVSIHHPASNLLREETIASYDGKPLTLGHPAYSGPNWPLTPKSWREITIGTVRNPRADGDRIIADLLVYDRDAIDMIQRGERRELSIGSVDEFEPTGMTVDGAPEWVVVSHVGNHVALCKSGKCGDQCAIQREMKGGRRMADATKREGRPRSKFFHSALRTIGLLREDVNVDAVIAEAVETAAEEAITEAVEGIKAETTEVVGGLEAQVAELKAAFASLQAAVEAMQAQLGAAANVATPTIETGIGLSNDAAALNRSRAETLSPGWSDFDEGFEGRVLASLGRDAAIAPLIKEAKENGSDDRSVFIAAATLRASLNNAHTAASLNRSAAPVKTYQDYADETYAKRGKV